MAGRDRKKSFDITLKNLEEVVRRLDDQALPLDEALDLFEKGIGHYRACTTSLEEARLRVVELVKEAGGNLTVELSELGEETDADSSEEET